MGNIGDDVMMAMAVAGMGLTGFYVKAELTRWIRSVAADARRELGLKQLYVGRFSPPTPAKLSQFGRDAAANQSNCRVNHAA